MDFDIPERATSPPCRILLRASDLSEMTPSAKYLRWNPLVIKTNLLTREDLDNTYTLPGSQRNDICGYN